MYCVSHAKNGKKCLLSHRLPNSLQDVGHYFAGSKGLSPLPVLEKYHDRIRSLHMKDRTADGGNLPWGQGQTPLRQVLQLMRKEKWTFPADIEVEYPISPGSSPVAEVAKCVQFCKDALA